MRARYSIGLDYGTNSVRALIVDVPNGREVGTAVWEYAHGTQGVILSRDPNLARQHPTDYLDGAEITIQKALAQARRKVNGFKPDQVVGLGVDTTGSTPMPVDARGRALAFDKRFARNPAAMAWLWKDHTGVLEAAEITEAALEMRPHYLAKCGGTYSSEWFFSKILHCLHTSPDVFDAAYTWVEIADWIPSMLTGTEAPDKLTVGICAAGHKAMYNDTWGGYPDAEFLGSLHPRLGELRARLPAKSPHYRTRGWRADGGLGQAHRSASKGFPWRWAHSTPIWAPLARGSRRAHWSKSSAPAPATSCSRRSVRSSRTFPASVASSTAVCCRGTMDWKQGNRRSAISSTGL